MRTSFAIIIVLLLTIGQSCRKDFDLTTNYGSLEFSKDTVFLDTIFSNVGSATYHLKVYNRSNQNITIPEIKLNNGSASNYRLNVDGAPGKTFTDINLLAKDSLYIFIETTINFNTVTDPLYTDKILFNNGTNQQEVELVTLVKDAHFIFPAKNEMGIETLVLDGVDLGIQGRYLTDSELTFTKEKPYVIYGYAAVPSDKTLTIEAGTEIHFHKNSGIIVDKKGSIKANGTKEEKIILEGDRLEHSFENVSGQWGTLWLRAGSKDNIFNHTLIKNATVGIIADSIGSNTSPTLSIKNTEVYNNSAYGVLGRNTSINAENLVIGNSGLSSLACIYGGSYNFTHITIGNFWNNSFRELPAVIISNNITYENQNGEKITEVSDLIAANFTNSIVDGNNNVEFFLDKVDGSTFNYQIKNCLLKFDDISNAYPDVVELDFNDTNHYQNIFLNNLSDFKDPSNNNFTIGRDSEAINKGIPSSVSEDILGTNRNNSIDLGAYQYVPL